jgi:hypothetical protein
MTMRLNPNIRHWIITRFNIERKKEFSLKNHYANGFKCFINLWIFQTQTKLYFYSSLDFQR